jgi:hypothetical protein
MPDQSATDVSLRDLIDRYLDETGIAGDKPRVVPLTGDASDRKYFRIIPSDGAPIVLALHAGAIDFATLPFAKQSDYAQAIGNVMTVWNIKSPTEAAQWMRNSSLNPTLKADVLKTVQP